MYEHGSATCPYCRIYFHRQQDMMKFVFVRSSRSSDLPYCWVASETCPKCAQLMVWLVTSCDSPIGPSSAAPDSADYILIYPRVTNRPPIPPEVPETFAEDYKEACLIISDSPKASAALSRRCLQNILEEQGGVKHGRLQDEINQVKDSGTLPSAIVELMDEVRGIGNMAAHPEKRAEEIVPIEVWEAEWCLEIIEALFDHYFVMPARNRERTERMKEKRRTN